MGQVCYFTLCYFPQALDELEDDLDNLELDDIDTTDINLDTTDINLEDDFLDDWEPPPRYEFI